MATTILDALENAEVNVTTIGRQAKGIPMLEALAALAGAQLHNAVTLLEKGYGVHEDVDPFIDEYGSVENAPDKES